MQNLAKLSIGDIAILSDGTLNLTAKQFVLGKYAFAGCEQITKIIIQTVTMNDGCLSLINLTTISFFRNYEGVELIGTAFPFIDCEKISNVEFVQGMTCAESHDINYQQFFGDTNVVNYSWNYFGCTEADGIFYLPGSQRTILERVTVNTATFSVPDQVIKILSNCFKDSSVTRVQTGSTDQLEQIANDAFEGSQVYFISFPPRFNKLPANFLKGATTIEEIKFDNYLYTIPEGAFSDMPKLKKIQLQGSTTYILHDGNLTFTDNALSNVGPNIFLNVPNISRIIISNSMNSIDLFPMKNRPQLVEVEIPRETTSIPSNYFEGCPNLKLIKIGSSFLLQNGILDFRNTHIELIGSSAFGVLSIVEKLILPSTAIKLQNRAFAGLSNLNSVQFGRVSNHIQFEGDPFYGLNKLNLTLPAPIFYPDDISFSALFRNSNLQQKDWTDFGAIRVPIPTCPPLPPTPSPVPVSTCPTFPPTPLPAPTCPTFPPTPDPISTLSLSFSNSISALSSETSVPSNSTPSSCFCPNIGASKEESGYSSGSIVLIVFVVIFALVIVGLIIFILIKRGNFGNKYDANDNYANVDI